MIWDDARTVAFDFETSGTLPEYALQPWRLKTNDFWATSISVIHRKDKSLQPWMSKLFPTVVDMRTFLHAAIDNDWLVVMWNGIYDVSILIAYGLRDLVYKVRWIDGLLLWKHLEIDPEYDVDKPRKKSYALKPDAVNRFIPGFADTTGADEVDFHSRDPAELAKLQHYNNRDSVRTLVIAKIIWDQLSEDQRRAALIEAEAIPMVAEANLNGMPIDQLFCSELSQWLKHTAEKRLIDLEPHGVNEAVVRSPTKMAALLYDQWGLPVIKETTGKKTGRVSRSTDKEVLYELAFADPRCKLLKEYREALNNDTKFAQAPLASAIYNGDGRSRPAAIMFGTYTGRMTYASKQGKNKDTRQTGFALHQEKRGKEFRGIVQAPPGYTLVEFDAAGQEFRWMAIQSRDTAMLQLCLPGEDPHGYMAAQIVGADYRELVALVAAEDENSMQNRYLGKVANLCIAEGTTILTDRGPCNIEQVTLTDKVWDGDQFVAHDGLSFSGVREVITHQGVTATLQHKVLIVDDRGHERWDTIEAAARHGWRIQSALGSGRTRRARAAVRVMGGLIRRAIYDLWRALREGSVPVRSDQGRQFRLYGDRAIDGLPQLCDSPPALPERQIDCRYAGEETTTEASQCHASAVHQPEGSVVSQLWRSWDRVSLRDDQGRGGLHPGRAAGRVLRWLRYRSNQQRRALRAWKLALGYTQGKPSQSRQVRTYDIVNCGPNTRFAANGVIVHNSLQYRTYPKTFRKVARVQYDIPIELPEAQRIHKTYQQTYPEVPRYWQRAIHKVKQLGYAETLAGRRVQVVGNWEGSLAWKMESTALNYPIQGTGGDQKYLAMKLLKDYLLQVGGYFAWDLHDGIYLYIPDNMVDRVAVEARHMLNNLPYQQAWGFTPPIPMPWDCKTGKSWGLLKEYKI